MKPRIGVMPPSISIFDQEGKLDIERTCEHLDWLVDSGVDSLLVGGTCGEFFSLEIEERRELSAKSIEAVQGRVPVYVGVMDTSTRRAVDLARAAEEAGATGVLAVPPYYTSPPEAEVLQYFRDIAGAIDIPLAVYNNPAASGVELSIAALVELAEDGTAGIIKESHGDPTRIHDLRLKVPDEVALVYGEDYGAFEAIAAGADGWVAGVGNFMPRHSVQLWNLLREGQLEKAREHWFRILPLVNITSSKPMFGRPDERPDFIQVYKSALDRLGRSGGESRKPLLPLPEPDRELLGSLMDDLGLEAATA